MMEVTEAMRDLAVQILAHDAGLDGVPLPASQQPDLRAFEKLRLHMAKFVGTAGYRALLTRASARAQAEAPYLKSIQVRADGTLDGHLEVAAGTWATETAKEEQVFLAHLLELLMTFIGEALTVRLVRDIWPDVKLNLFLSTRRMNAEVTR